MARSPKTRAAHIVQFKIAKVRGAPPNKIGVVSEL